MKNNIFPRMHASLYVSDIQKSIQFYSSFFDTEPVKVKMGYAKYVLEEPSLIISFVENKERVQQNFGHLGFQVETLDQLKEQRDIANTKGLIQKEEIGANCCYAKQDKFWVNDPDGIQWEVYYFHEDAEFNDPHADEKSKTCCIPIEENKMIETNKKLNSVSCCEPETACCVE